LIILRAPLEKLLYPGAFVLFQGSNFLPEGRMAKKKSMKGWVKAVVIALVAVVAASNIKPLRALVGPGA